MPFEFEPQAIADILLIRPRKFPDGRGFFMETYKESDFQSHGVDCNFVQDNFSCSDEGVLRGLHFQVRPYAQGKLVRVTVGKVFDVAVDIRLGSETFGQSVSVILSADNHQMLWIPAGFAHGFLSLEDNTQLHYKCAGNEYSPAAERVLAWDDSDLNINWPRVDKLQLSNKDIQGAMPLTLLREREVLA